MKRIDGGRGQGPLKVGTDTQIGLRVINEGSRSVPEAKGRAGEGGLRSSVFFVALLSSFSLVHQLIPGINNQAAQAQR